jgi:hypothetical protein
MALPALLFLVVAGGSSGVLGALHGADVSNGAAALAPLSDPPRPATPTPEPSSTPLPANPDTSKGGWAIPYLEADRLKPRHNRMVNSIAVGPSVQIMPSVTCQPGSPQWAPIDQAVGSPVAIAPKYLPPGTALGPARATLCSNAAGQTIVIGADADYWIPPDVAHGDRGGAFSVSRGFVSPPAATLSIPDERWSGGTIAGHPAAVARPILANGLGESAVVIASDGGVITIVQATGLTLENVLRIAEGLF